MTEKYLPAILRETEYYDMIEQSHADVDIDYGLEHYFEGNQGICKLIHFNELQRNGCEQYPHQHRHRRINISVVLVSPPVSPGCRIQKKPPRIDTTPALVDMRGLHVSVYVCCSSRRYGCTTAAYDISPAGCGPA